MGNCCLGGSSSSMAWAGEDWSDSISPAEDRVGMKKPSPRRGSKAPAGKEGGFSRLCSSTMTSSNGTVKIKMTKRELEKLLKEVEMQGMSLEQVMARLTGSCDGYSFTGNGRHQPWRPALQSIPEVD